MIEYSNIKPFVYVIVCSDLDFRQRVVQASHAALESGIHEEHCKEFPSGLIVLQVEDEKELIKAEEHLYKKGIKSKLFYENPMKRYTALATEALPSKKRHILRQYKLLSMHRPTLWQKVKRVFRG
jgi:hypothetical protein